MERLNNLTNKRVMMAKLIKGYIESVDMPIYLTNGSEIFLNDDNKIRMREWEERRFITKRWGRINFDRRLEIVGSLLVNPVFKEFYETFISNIPSEEVLIEKYFDDTAENRNIIAKTLKSIVETKDVRHKWNNIFIGIEGKLRMEIDGAIRAWGRMSWDKRINAIKELIETSSLFVEKSNEVLSLYETTEEEIPSRFLLEDYLEKTTDNKNLVSKILKSYLSAGNKIDCIEISESTGKLLFVGEIIGVSGKGFKTWGSIKWDERVNIIKSLSEVEEFYNFSNEYLTK